MSQQIYDSSGNPVTQSGATGSPDQQVADGSGLIINPSTEDTLSGIKDQTDQFTFTAGDLNVNATVNVGPIGLLNAADVRINPATTEKQDTGNTSLSSIDGKIPASPSQEHTAAGSPHAARLTDGTTFYKATTPSDTQPVSGTITANAGTGTFVVGDGGGSLTVDGTVAATQSGTWTVQPGNTANTTPWLTTLNEGGNSAAVTASNALKVDGSAVTQPISAASLPLPTGAATEATLSTLNTKFISGTDIGDVTINNAAGASAVNIQDGGNSITVDGTVAATQSGTWNITDVSGTISLPTGAATSSNQTDGSQRARILDSAGTAITSSLVNGRQAVDVHQADTSFVVSGLSAVGAAPAANPVTVSGVDGGGLKRHLLTDTTGRVRVVTESLGGYRQTYSAAASQVAMAATATDFFTITGSASKTIRIVRLDLTLTSTTTTVVYAFLIKRSTANSGGTSTTLTNVPHDSNNAAATAVIQTYTANPTLGTAVGTVVTHAATSLDATPAAGDSGPPESTVFEAGAHSQAITLRGTAEVLAINFGGITLSGGLATAHVEWTEE